MGRMTSDRGLVVTLIVVIVMNAIIGIGAARYYAEARDRYIVGICKSHDDSVRVSNHLNKKLHKLFAILTKRAAQSAKIDKGAKRKIDVEGVVVWSGLRDSSRQTSLARC